MCTLAHLSVDILAHILSFFNKTCEPRQFTKFCATNKAFYEAAKLQAKQLFGEYVFSWRKYGQVMQKNCITILKIDAAQQEQLQGLSNAVVSHLVIEGGFSAPANTLEYVPASNLQALRCKYVPISDLGKIQWDKFVHLEQLYLVDAGLASIDAIVVLKSLKRLDVSRNAIINVDCLAQITGLTSLNVHENKLFSIGALEMLVNLKELNISRNNITGIDKVVTKLKQLNHLNVCHSQLHSVDWISELQNTLTYLDISYNGYIKDVSALSALIHLQWLDISSNSSLGNVNCINSMPNLKNFKCDNTFIQLLPFPPKCNLRHLEFSMKQLQDMAFLECMPELRSIKVECYNGDDFNRLKQCTKLESIKFTRNEVAIPDASFLTHLPNLRKVDVRCDKIQTIVATGPCFQQVTSMNLSGNPIENIDCLKYATLMTKLRVRGCNLTDISVIANMPNLKRLDISTNMISDIGSLSGLMQLTNLQAERNRISTLAPLMNLQELQVLEICKNPTIPASEIVTLAKTLPKASRFQIDERYRYQIDFHIRDNFYLDFFDPDLDYD